MGILSTELPMWAQMCGATSIAEKTSGGCPAFCENMPRLLLMRNESEHPPGLGFGVQLGLRVHPFLFRNGGPQYGSQDAMILVIRIPKIVP